MPSGRKFKSFQDSRVLGSSSSSSSSPSSSDLSVSVLLLRFLSPFLCFLSLWLPSAAAAIAPRVAADPAPFFFLGSSWSFLFLSPLLRLLVVAGAFPVNAFVRWLLVRTFFGQLESMLPST